ncbi:hypothetical protein FG05_30377 [Fusarium graminearum]|nr:hypothetical protein FG05_30377 [Fusarium graminearum]
MSPVNIPSSVFQMTNASSHLEGQAASTVEQTDNEEVRTDSQTEEAAEYGMPPTNWSLQLAADIESGDKGLEEYQQRFMARLVRYYQFVCQFSKIMDFDEPNGVFLHSSLYLAKKHWGEEKGIHLRAENEDWASLHRTDKPDQWICYLVHHPLSRYMMRAMKLVSNEGGIMITFISERYASCYIDT